MPSSRLQTRSCPLRAAKCRAVPPKSVGTLGSALPFCNRSMQVSRCPFRLATWRAVNVFACCAISSEISTSAAASSTSAQVNHTGHALVLQGSHRQGCVADGHLRHALLPVHG
eukprot:scaffold7440_cov417-Prasinococcus_capsulatus_cf.AAC.2